MSFDRASSPHGRHGPGWPLLALLGVGVIVLGAALFAFANPFGNSNDNKAATRYVEAELGTPSRVNPLFAYGSDTDRDLASLVFSGLVRVDADGTPLPDLAQSWDVSSDGLTVVFHLRPNVTWQSGGAFTSADVLFTYGLLANTALQGDPEQAALWQSIKCTAPDSLTVSCALPEPFAPFLAYATMGILPSAILSSATPQSILDDPFNKRPDGTGPYSVVEMTANHALLRANPGFYLGAPHIDEIELKFYPNMSSAAADVVRGNADGLLADLTIDPNDYQTLRGVDGLDSHTANRSTFTILYLNDGAPPMNDPAVRSAIARAVDVDSVITDQLGGRGQRADTPIVPGSWAYDSSARAPSHDVGQARSILEADGWVLPANSTVRQKNNTELRISLITDQDALRGAIADAIAAQLADAGINATVVRQPSNSLVRDFLIPRQYQAAIFGLLEPGADPDPYPAWHSSQTVNNGRNIAGYTSSDADKLVEEARRSFDIANRKSLYSKFQALFLLDVPSIPLYVPIDTYFVRSKVSGVDPGVLFSPASRFRNVYQWTIANPLALGGN